MLRSGSEIKLNLGSGDVKGQNGWTNVDMKPNCDLHWNLKYPLPFPKDRVSCIYSSHLFEHLHFPHLLTLMKECVRVLAPGGTFSIVVPNARMYIDAYLENRQMDLNELYAPGFNQTTQIDYVNYIAYMNEDHKYMFDRENLYHLMEKSGLVDVKPRSYDPNLDQAGRDFESIYATGIKPCH